MGKRNNTEPAVENELVVEEAAPAVEATKPATTGTVTDCVRLNVRRTASLKATIVCEIPRGATVTINERKSTDEWYSVRTAEGDRGFCMKKYITISQ